MKRKKEKKEKKRKIKNESTLYTKKQEQIRTTKEIC